MVSRKQRLRRISALAADGARDAKRAKVYQNWQASSVHYNLDNHDQDDSINNIELPPSNEPV